MGRGTTLNKLSIRLLKSLPATVGILVSLLIIVGVMRNLFPMILGSAIWGAVPIAFLTLLVGVTLGVVLLLNSFVFLRKTWNLDQKEESK